LWYWFVRYKDNSYGFLGGGINGKTELLEDKDLQHYSAYTVAELLNILGDIFLCIELYCPSKGKWLAQTRSYECDCKKCKEELKKNPEYLAINWATEEGKKPADVLAKMLIYLIKKKLIKV